MLIDIDLRKKRALIIGGGAEAELKAAKLVDSGAAITVMAARFTKRIEVLARAGGIRLLKRASGDFGQTLRELEPDILFISTGKPELDAELAGLGRSLGILLCVVDAPQHNDFNMPAIARIGPLRVAITTDGKSPAMAKILRKRIEKMITPQDLLQVELQGSIREAIGGAVRSHGERKRLVYEVIGDSETARLLKEGDLEAAKLRASEMIRKHRRPRAKS